MQEKYVIANGVRLAYDEFGDSTDPAMLLIMGLATQMIAWPESFCEQLAAQGYWVIRYDNRDIGLSEKIENAKPPNVAKLILQSKLRLSVKVPYSLKDMADDSVGLLDALKIDKAHIVGVSMGGMIGQLVTAHAASRVHTFTSIMSTSGDKKIPAAKRHITAAMLRRPDNSEQAVLANKKEVLRLISSPAFPPSEKEMTEKILSSYRRSYYPAGGLRHIAAIIHCGSRVAALQTITRPTLVIHGKEDVLVNVEGGIDTARHIRDAKLELIEGMGHDLPKELIPRFVDLIANHARGN